VFFIFNWFSFQNEKSKLKPISAGTIKPLFNKGSAEGARITQRMNGVFCHICSTTGESGFRLLLF